MTKSKDTSQKSVQRAAKAIELRVEQLEAVNAPKEEQNLRFHQPSALRLYNKFPIMADRLTLKAGNKTLLKETRFQFPLGSTIAVKGNNGPGKSTLLRHIFQKGEGVIISPKAVIGCYEQMGYQFEKEESVLAYMKDRSDYEIAPSKPILNSITYKQSSLTGKAETFATISVYRGKTFLKSANVTTKGTFSISIGKQKRGTVLTVYAKDASGNISSAASIKVK